YSFWGGCTLVLFGLLTANDLWVTPLNSYPDTLQLDAQLKVLGLDDYAAPMLTPFHSAMPTRGLIEQFIADAPRFSGSSFRIVEPTQWASLELSPYTPVLFFNTTWKMNYKRLPPQFKVYRFEVGVIAKVIPLGQVLSKKGTIAARNASWEGSCHIDDGIFHHVDEWSENEGRRLKQAIYSVQSICGRKLVDEFMEDMPEGYPVHQDETVEVWK
ncbi:MAG: hypothetical protein RQ936_03935, partial [Gammaproteobacteria bacterium]|nr:hypothetical protein [Gammaproteobacteria bacterium]